MKFWTYLFFIYFLFAFANAEFSSSYEDEPSDEVAKGPLKQGKNAPSSEFESSE